MSVDNGIILLPHGLRCIEWQKRNKSIPVYGFIKMNIMAIKNSE